MSWLVVLVAAALGFYMAWTIGANDVANSMADAIGSRSISLRGAVIAAGICEFLGSVLVGAHVTETIRKGIVSADSIAAASSADPETLGPTIALGMCCALLAAALWLHLSSWMGMPVSTTHSIVGAVAGFGLVAAGIHAVNMPKMGQIVASWFISPVAGALLAYFTFRLMTRFVLGRDHPARAAITFGPVLIFYIGFILTMATVYKGLKHIIGQYTWLDRYSLVVAVLAGLASAIASRVFLKRRLRSVSRAPLGKQLERVERVFAPFVVVSSCCVAFAHGANDVANSVGPLAAVVDIMHTGQVHAKVPVPLWVLCLGGLGIVVGLATYGYRVMYLVGRKITVLTPSRGVAADISAMTVVLVFSRLSIPISTTHTLVGAIMGVGLARGLAAINRRVTRNIFGSWLLTVPAAGGVSALLFLIGRSVFL